MAQICQFFLSWNQVEKHLEYRFFFYVEFIKSIHYNPFTWLKMKESLFLFVHIVIHISSVE